ncbi:hypothetical protein D8S78_24465 [Natrialba swarupiae]|nr:hypothetical protein [Natrialba swarupiae]
MGFNHVWLDVELFGQNKSKRPVTTICTNYRVTSILVVTRSNGTIKSVDHIINETFDLFFNCLLYLSIDDLVSPFTDRIRRWARRLEFLEDVKVHEMVKSCTERMVESQLFCDLISSQAL